MKIRIPLANKRMQLAGASILKETSACAQAGESPQLMRGPLDCSLAHAIMRLKILVLTGLLPCSGCGDEAQILGNACEPTVSITISSAAIPKFTWEPQCGVAVVYVQTALGNAVWMIHSAPGPDLAVGNDIESGVVYGVVPAGAREFIAPTVLEGGQGYRVSLHIFDTQGNDTQVGVATFTVPAE